MTWKPLSEEGIWDLVRAAEARMSVRQAYLWEVIRIAPEKWTQHPYGDEGAGFGAVGLIGRFVVWYNDIEGSLNRSRYASYGAIDGYYCHQDDLEVTIEGLLGVIETGDEAGAFLGPPQPIR